MNKDWQNGQQVKLIIETRNSETWEQNPKTRKIMKTGKTQQGHKAKKIKIKYKPQNTKLEKLIHMKHYRIKYKNRGEWTQTYD